MIDTILNTLIENYSNEKLIKFFNSRSNCFVEIDEPFEIDLTKHVNKFQQVQKIGNLEFDKNKRYGIYSIKTIEDLNDRSSKRQQFELSKLVLKNEDKTYDGGLFVFYDDKGNFRLSLVYIEYIGTRVTWSYYKRFTFYVNPQLANNTFKKQIGKCNFQSIEEIKEAFSVEPVTKEFYNEIQHWYYWAIDKIQFPDDYKYHENPEKDKEIRNATTLIRLITRIIFVWFLKEKKLIPEDLFSKEKLKDIVKDFLKDKNSHNFYNAILQNLFFATLNQKMDERKFAEEGDFYSNRNEYGIKSLYRYADKFLIDKNEVLNLFKNISFLNGGLFDCLDKEDENNNIIYIDGFSRNPKKAAIIPDYLFFEEQEKKVDLSYYGLGKGKPVRGLIEILNSYNFTIDENTPIDQEIALDPELLGKIFENLLASYNPETATTARKATGSFYTPREIVDYMVDKSLYEYLKIKLTENDNNLETQELYTFFNPENEIDIHYGNLPHWQQKDVWYFVTFRLADSIPEETINEIRQKREQWLKIIQSNQSIPALNQSNQSIPALNQSNQSIPALDKSNQSIPALDKNKQNTLSLNTKNLTLEQKKEYYKLFSERIEKLLDSGLGSCILKDERIAKIVADALNHFNNKRYILDDWVIMPNHVHVLVKPLGDNKLSDILHTWKSYTANEINKILGKNGQLWMHESYDHIVRNNDAFYAIKKYIRENPKKANIILSDYCCSWKYDEVEIENSLKKLLSYADEVPELTEEQKEKIINAIDKIKILDPACGSGAFLMGALHKLVYILQKLDPDNKYWYDLQYRKAIEQSEEAFKNQDKKQREELLKEINETFDESINYPDYARKLYLIENCIYGVDIQPIAIQISKLRFFISLILDQKIDKDKENFGIMALPNLETKFVAANTLIALQKPTHIYHTRDIEEIENEIKQLRHKHFQAKTRSEKVYYRKKDKELRERLSEELNNVGYSTESSEKIVKFDIFDQNASADWFDPEWMFGLTEGFDIVIGNPPYISTKGVDSNTKKLLEQNYGFSDDSYNHFYFKGLELLKPKGILAYISSKTFWTIQTKKNLRELLLKNKILQLFDTANPFASAMVDTCIVIIQKKDPEIGHQINFLDLENKDNFCQPNVYSVAQEVFATAPNKVFFIPTPLNIKIYNKLGKIVNNLLNQWWDKISTSKNIEKNKKLLEEYRKNLKPGDITLLGLITEGGQGLATANNGKYIGVLDGTKWSDKVREERPEKLLLATDFCSKYNIKNKKDAQNFLNKLSEIEIRKLFDDLKEKYGRDIFGQGWLYRIVSKEEIADINKLTEDEKQNGIKREKTFVPYDKGDKEGNRWYAPTPYYIDWSRENVKFLKENSGKKGEGMPVVRNSQFYFREGFCWNNVTGDKIICRIKEKSVHSTEAMTFMSVSSFASDKYIICLLNSSFFSIYKNLFLNITVHLTTGDAKEFPIIIPTSDQLKRYENIFDRAYNIQKQKFEGKISESEAEEKLAEVQRELDETVEEMYMGE